MRTIIPHKLNAEVSEHPRLKAAYKVCKTLIDAGWESYWVGGSVRDLYLWPDRVPKDIDIATNARLNDICKLIPKTQAIGRAFGVGLCECDGFHFEVATFRKESDYVDRRHPSKVSSGTIEEDSARRDFTVNALYFNPIESKILDFHHGIADLQLRRLQCVGDPSSRLHEDPLRILRLFRFASNLEMSIAEGTRHAAERLSGELLHVSLERVLLEISKIKASALGTFVGFLQPLQATLLRSSNSTKEDFEFQQADQSQTVFSLPAESLQFPATVFALMCIYNEGFARRDWCRIFSNWPFSLTERSQLELAVKTAQGAFALPQQLLKLSQPEKWKTIFENLKWLSRQNRVQLADAQWIGEFVQRQQSQDNFISALSQLCAQAPLQTGLADAIEKYVAERAKPLRTQLQVKLVDEQPQLLGWARLIIDWGLIFGDLAPAHTDLPEFLNIKNPKHLDEVIAAARILQKKGNLKKIQETPLRESPESK